MRRPNACAGSPLRKRRKQQQKGGYVVAGRTGDNWLRAAQRRRKTARRITPQPKSGSDDDVRARFRGLTAVLGLLFVRRLRGAPAAQVVHHAQGETNGLQGAHHELKVLLQGSLLRGCQGHDFGPRYTTTAPEAVVRRQLLAAWIEMRTAAFGQPPMRFSTYGSAESCNCAEAPRFLSRQMVAGSQPSTWARWSTRMGRLPADRCSRSSWTAAARRPWWRVAAGVRRPRRMSPRSWSIDRPPDFASSNETMRA